MSRLYIGRLELSSDEFCIKYNRMYYTYHCLSYPFKGIKITAKFDVIFLLRLYDESPNCGPPFESITVCEAWQEKKMEANVG